MGTKMQPGDYDCYQKAAPDEPLFTLLARDENAPLLVLLWAALAQAQGERPEKVIEARQCAAAMLTWKETR